MPRPRKNLSEMLREAVNNDNSPDTSIPRSSQPSKKPQTTETSSKVDIIELEAKIRELSSTLETVTQRAEGLQTQVGSLELELKTQKDLVQTLQEKLQQSQTVQATLDEQKKLVTKLTKELTATQTLQSELDSQKELVSKLYAELQAVQQEKTTIKTSSTTTEKTLVKTNPYDLTPRPYRRYIAPQADSTILSNDVIGWFD